LVKAKQAIEANGETKKIVLDPRVLDKAVFLGTDMPLKEEAELLPFLNKISDIFAWSTSDLIGVRRHIIEYKLQVNLAAMPRKYKLCKMLEEKVVTVKAEVQRLLDIDFIRESSSNEG
jgi:hypothetical protein